MINVFPQSVLMSECLLVEASCLISTGESSISIACTIFHVQAPHFDEIREREIVEVFSTHWLMNEQSASLVWLSFARADYHETKSTYAWVGKAMWVYRLWQKLGNFKLMGRKDRRVLKRKVLSHFSLRWLTEKIRMKEWTTNRMLRRGEVGVASRRRGLPPLLDSVLHRYLMNGWS